MLRTNQRLDQVIKKQNDYDSGLQRAEARQEMLENKVNVVTNEISQLECGPVPNVMVALPNVGGALCSTPQSLADTHY